MKCGRKQSWTALTQAQKAERRPAQSQQLKWKEQHIQARALKLQARMMDSRKGGTPTIRRPDGGATRGVFYGKINTPGFISANQNCEYQNLKNKRSSKEQRDLQPATAAAKPRPPAANADPWAEDSETTDKKNSKEGSR